MRQAIILLVFLYLIAALAPLAPAADLVQQVPLNAPAYQQLDTLQHGDLLSTTQEDLLASIPAHTLTRYQFALMLIEPLERLISLVEAQDNPASALAPEQRRRRELANQAVSKLSATEFDRLLKDAGQLRLTFAEDLEKLEGGLSARAAVALGKLAQPHYRPWLRAISVPSTEGDRWHFSWNPRATPDSIGSPLPLLDPMRVGGPTELPFKGPDGGSETDGSWYTKSATSIEWAMDLALGSLTLRGAVATKPGQDPSQLFKPSSVGRAMLDFRFDLAKVNDLGITGIFQYHLMRSGDPGNTSTNTGMVGGIGINW